MRIVLFNWRDLKNPRAGGAETYTHHALSTLHADGHECVLFASSAPGLKPVEELEHYTVVRQGTELTCRFHAAQWLRRRRASVDLVIDEVNTLPWFSPLIEPGKTILLIHQLAREVWWAEAPFWAAAPGYVLEPLYLSLYKNSDVITVSDSSARSLRDIGLRGAIHVVDSALPPAFDEPGTPQTGLVGYVGRLAPSKRIDHVIRAVAIARQRDPRVRLRVVGGGTDSEVRRLKALTERLGITEAVEFMGRVSDDERDRLLREVDVLAMASLREGWGLVVTEAARWRIPSVAYAVPGLCDSIVDGRTGLLVPECTPQTLGDAMVRVIRDRPLRDALGEAAAQRLSEFGIESFQRKLRAVIAGL